jgi:hypothetical protein
LRRSVEAGARLEREVRLDTAKDREAGGTAMGAAGSRARWRFGLGFVAIGGARREQQLQAPKRVALVGVEQPEGPDAVRCT